MKIVAGIKKSTGFIWTFCAQVRAALGQSEKRLSILFPGFHSLVRSYWLAFLFLAIGLLEIGLRLQLVPGNFELVVRDTGKTFFHLVLLPFVVALTMSIGEFPFQRRESGATADSGVTSRAILVVLCLLAVVTAFMMARSDFSGRLKAPEDLKSEVARTALANFREDLRVDDTASSSSKCEKALVASFCLVHEIHSPSECIRFSSSIAAGSGCKKDPSEYFVGQVAKSEKYRIDRSWAAFVEKASERRWVASTLVAMANVVVVYVIWLLLIRQRSILAYGVLNKGGTLPKKDFHDLLKISAAVALLVIWVPLNIYSERQLSFGEFLDQNPAFELGVAVGLVSFIVTSLLISVVVRDNSPQPWWALTFSAITGTLNFAWTLAPDNLSATFDRMDALTTGGFLILQIAAALLLLNAAYVWSKLSLQERAPTLSVDVNAQNLSDE